MWKERHIINWFRYFRISDFHFCSNAKSQEMCNSDYYQFIFLSNKLKMQLNGRDENV